MEKIVEFFLHFDCFEIIRSVILKIVFTEITWGTFCNKMFRKRALVTIFLIAVKRVI